MTGSPVLGIPKPIVDFLEGLVSAFVTGAALNVDALNLGAIGPKAVLGAALLGGINAVISAARRGLTPA